MILHSLITTRKKIATNRTKYTLGGRASGFTMVEMLIAMSIFMIFIALSAGSYLGLMKANRVAGENQRIYRDVRHVFDTLAAEAHNSQLDFNCFNRLSIIPDISCIENQQSDVPKVVAFISSDGTTTSRRLYKLEDKTVKVMHQQRDASGISWDTTADWQPLTANATTFDDVSFTIFPLKNPYDSENVSEFGVQWQPSIGISITRGSTTYKTTYSSRSYGTASLYKNPTPEFNLEVPRRNLSL